MTIDRAARQLCISMSGAWTDGPVDAGDLFIYDWDKLHQKRYDLTQNVWVDIPQGEEEAFKDIPEFTSDGHQIVMRGFGRVTGEWLELILEGGHGEYTTNSGSSAK